MSLHLGIVGPGRISDDQHAPAIAAIEGVELWSVMSRDKKRALAFAEKHQAQASSPAHDSLDSMLADPALDAVIIATPDRFHSAQTTQAARAGKHVLVEKPMATSLEEADAMISACQENDRSLGIAYHLRWHAGHRAIRDKIRSGAIGDVRHVRVHWTFKAADGSNWRATPETGRWWSLAANGTHCLDLVRWLLVRGSGEIEAIHAVTGGRVWDTPHDETAIVAARFESGTTAEFCVSVLFDSPSRIEIYGSEGDVICDATMGRHGAGDIYINGQMLNYDIKNPFVGEITDFVRAIEEGREPEVGGVEGKRNIELLMMAAKDL